jgi:hypothetical protein
VSLRRFDLRQSYEVRELEQDIDFELIERVSILGSYVVGFFPKIFQFL